MMRYILCLFMLYFYRKDQDLQMCINIEYENHFKTSVFSFQQIIILKYIHTLLLLML
jgi:hypothetical protein